MTTTHGLASAARRRSREGAIGVGMPHWLKLNLFGRIVCDAFGELPYLVGSAATRKQWRDVDVRLLLNEEQWAHHVGAQEPECRGVYYGGRHAALALAFSALGREMTGLPIDFQLQQQERANALYPYGRRVPLGVTA